MSALEKDFFIINNECFIYKNYVIRTINKESSERNSFDKVTTYYIAQYNPSLENILSNAHVHSSPSFIFSNFENGIWLADGAIHIMPEYAYVTDSESSGLSKAKKQIDMFSKVVKSNMNYFYFYLYLVSLTKGTTANYLIINEDYAHINENKEDIHYSSLIKEYIEYGKDNNWIAPTSELYQCQIKINENFMLLFSKEIKNISKSIIKIENKNNLSLESKDYEYTINEKTYLFYNGQILEFNKSKEEVYLLDLSILKIKYTRLFLHTNQNMELINDMCIKGCSKILIATGHLAKEKALEIINNKTENGKGLSDELFFAYVLVLFKKNFYINYLLDEDVFIFNPYENKDMMRKQMINYGLLSNVCVNLFVKDKKCCELANIISEKWFNVWLKGLNSNIKAFKRIELMYNGRNIK